MLKKNNAGTTGVLLYNFQKSNEEAYIEPGGFSRIRHQLQGCLPLRYTNLSSISV